MTRWLTGLLVLAIAGTAILTSLSTPPAAPPPNFTDQPPVVTDALPLELDALTWTEVRALIASGKTLAIIPTGGTEQNGPHMVLGKHNYIMRHTAARIAEALGNALVAPVVTYVPEGRIDPPSGHMAYHGTISIPGTVFAATLESAAQSLRRHGFTTICLIGDSGGNQATLAAVAKKLNDEWSESGVRVLHISDYYFSANGQVEWLRSQGESDADIGSHAGIRDSSELLAVFPDGIRRDRMRPSNTPGMADSGVIGDPTRASAERGRKLLQLKIDAALRQIRRFAKSGAHPAS